VAVNSECSRCHPERSEGPAFLEVELSNQSFARSSQVGFDRSINAIFRDRSQPLICFSRAMALAGSAIGSK
jgi:hypothetical protein